MGDEESSDDDDEWEDAEESFAFPLRGEEKAEALIYCCPYSNEKAKNIRCNKGNPYKDQAMWRSTTKVI